MVKAVKKEPGSTRSSNKPPPAPRAKKERKAKKVLKDEDVEKKAVTYARLVTASSEDYALALPILSQMGLESFAMSEWGRGQGILQEYAKVNDDVGYKGPLSGILIDEEHVKDVWDLPAGELSVGKLNYVDHWKGYFQEKKSKDGYLIEQVLNPLHRAVARVLTPLFHPDKHNLIQSGLANAYAAEWKRIEEGKDGFVVNWLEFATSVIKGVAERIKKGTKTYGIAYVYQLAKAQNKISDEEDLKEEQLDNQSQLLEISDSSNPEEERSVLQSPEFAKMLDHQVAAQSILALKGKEVVSSPPRKKARIEDPVISSKSVPIPGLFEEQHFASYRKKLEAGFPELQTWEEKLSALSLPESAMVTMAAMINVCGRVENEARTNFQLMQMLGVSNAEEGLQVVQNQKKQLELLQAQLTMTTHSLEGVTKEKDALQILLTKKEHEKNDAALEAARYKKIVDAAQDQARVFAQEVFPTFKDVYKALDKKLETILGGIITENTPKEGDSNSDQKRTLLTKVQTLKMEFRDFNNIGSKLLKAIPKETPRPHSAPSPSTSYASTGQLA